MWLSIYPALILALPLRTLVLTAVLVPATVYVLVPGVTNALKRVTRGKSSAES
ncbi:hypothetical protein SAMN04489718_1244 [Actinopolyspora saharensis]|uniref:Uncharacterized protein n=2 Tax=Actinopolyspora saharensis TaxID=995062 RepID=A0A1H0ZU83_9ACTN|nr:hypothetical protein SAMN04489718_1244 [Actinopolyspora saharensis]